MKTFLFHSILAACLASSSFFAVAQEEEEGYSGNSRRTMRIVAMGSGAGDVTGTLYYEHKSKKTPLYFTVDSLSSEMPMPKGKSLTIYQEVQLPIEGTDKIKTGYINVGTVPLVSSSKNIVIISIPPDLTKNKIRGRAFKDSLTAHPEKTARIFNMSPKVVAVSAGKQSVKVASGGEGTIPWKAVAFNSVPYKIGTEGKKPGSWKIIESTECIAPPGTRTFIFVVSTQYDDKSTVTTTTCIDPVPEDDENSP